jgi:hypothetical protein
MDANAVSARLSMSCSKKKVLDNEISGLIIFLYKINISSLESIILNIFCLIGHAYKKLNHK